MAPVLAPWQLGEETLRCAVLGAVLGAARSLAPAKGRAAFVPDFLFAGALLVLLQSYAAGQSASGSLRWYMLVGGALGALAAHCLLAAPMAFARRALARAAAFPVRFVRQKALVPAAARLQRAKSRRAEKKNAKKRKKALQKQPHLLYNSNV